MAACCVRIAGMLTGLEGDRWLAPYLRHDVVDSLCENSIGVDGARSLAVALLQCTALQALK